MSLVQAPLNWASLAAIALAVWMVLAAFPAAPAPDGTELDQSWTLALNLAHAQGLVAGKDVVWTYGPLGYLSSPSPSSGEKYLPLIYRLGIYGIWAAALVRLRRRPWMVLTLGLAALLDPFIATDHLEVAVYAVALLVLADTPAWRDAELSLLAFLAGLCLLGKESLGTQALVMLACLMTVQFWQGRSLARQVLAPLGVLLVTVTGLYWASTGELASLPLYFRTSLELISGYSENMSTPGSALQVWLAIGAMATLVIGIPAVVEDRWKLLPVIPMAAFCSFAVFKNGIVRQGPAHFVSFAPKVMMASLFLLAVAQTARSRWLLIGFQAGCMAFSFWFSMQGSPGTPHQIEDRLLLKPTLYWTGIFLKWPASWKNLETVGKGDLSVLRVDPIYRGEVGAHSVDSIPWDVAQIPANGWKWKPRPVFQSYAAYTPVLDAIDAEHLKGSTAADFLLVSWKAIDGRHPFLEEPLTWQERLNRYQTDLHDRDLLLLKRRPWPRFRAVEKSIESTSRVAWDQEIAVPGDPRMEMRLAVGKSLWGSLRASLFRLNPMWLDLTRQSGKRERWRVVRANLTDGVRMRELPANLEDLTMLASGCSIPDPVISFRLHTDTPADYRSSMGLEWARGGEDRASSCTEIAPAQVSLDMRGGSETVQLHSDHDREWEVKSEVPWAEAEPESGGVRVTVEPNLAAKSRLGAIDVNGLQFRIFQAGVSAWTAVYRTVGSLGVFTFGSDETFIRTFGSAGDQPVLGDWTGSGVTRMGIYRKGAWFLDLNNNGKWDGVQGGDGYYEFGIPGDRAVVGDWNGDGTTKLGIYRAGVWVIDYKGIHKYDPSSGGLKAFLFGLATDLPVVSNWRHTGPQDQAGVYRNGLWYVDSNGDGKFESGVDDLYAFGIPGDIPVVVDWGPKNGGKKIAIYRRGTWVLDKNGDNRFDTGDLIFQSGKAGDLPLTGHWGK